MMLWRLAADAGTETPCVQQQLSAEGSKILSSLRAGRAETCEYIFYILPLISNKYLDLQRLKFSGLFATPRYVVLDQASV